MNQKDYDAAKVDIGRAQYHASEGRHYAGFLILADVVSIIVNSLAPDAEAPEPAQIVDRDGWANYVSALAHIAIMADHQSGRLSVDYEVILKGIRDIANQAYFREIERAEKAAK